MRKSEDATERVLAELFDNGAADYDAVTAMKDGQDLSTVDKVAFFATGTAKDYVRQGLYTEKSLAKATVQQLDKTDKIRYAYNARNPQTVTKSEFEHHYWVAVNGILTKDELGFLDSAIGKIKNGEYIKNADGFYMVPVGENGVLNKIVFTDGEYISYSIDTVIKINLDNETDLSIERSIIYVSERKGIYRQTKYSLYRNSVREHKKRRSRRAREYQ